MKKSEIPNLLTLIRICLVPIMIILSFFNLYIIVIPLAIIGALTDLLDGKLARMWHVTSLKGAKLDDVADKTFAIGLLICLTPRFFSVVLILLLEILIASLNYYYYKVTNHTETLMVGKIKTTFLFVTIIFYFINILTNNLDSINNGFRLATINLQLICLVKYYINFLRLTHKLTVEDSPAHKKIMNDETIVVESLDDLYKITKKDD